jgi:hypothetical protein
VEFNIARVIVWHGLADKHVVLPVSFPPVCATYLVVAAMTILHWNPKNTMSKRTALLTLRLAFTFPPFAAGCLRAATYSNRGQIWLLFVSFETFIKAVVIATFSFFTYNRASLIGEGFD